MLYIHFKLKLEAHLKWLHGESSGKKADFSGETFSLPRWANLSWADLSRANLSWANLSWANLSGANLDFSCWPFKCGSFFAKADMRLVAQLAKHLAMLDVSQCDDDVREAMRVFRQTPMASWFDSFRDDLAATPKD